MRHSVKLVTVLLAISLLLGGPALASEDAEEPRGVVVEEVGEGSALAKAGIQPGDVLLRWRRLAAPPANPEEASGEFRSWFDWEWVVVEQAPRGTVALSAQRGGQDRAFLVKPGIWKAEVQPRISNDEGEHEHHESTPRGMAQYEELIETSADWRLRCWAMTRLGTTLAEKKEWRRAQAAFQDALKEVEESFPESIIWHAVGDTYKKQGKFDEARQAYNSASTIREDSQSIPTLSEAESLTKLGVVISTLGDSEQASALFSKSLEIRQQLAPRSIKVAGSLHNLGVAASSKGNLEQAISYFEASLEIWREYPQNLGTAKTLNSLGIIAGRRGNLKQAEIFFHEAMNIHRGISQEDLVITQILNNLGMIAQLRGNLNQASALYQKALKLQRELEPNGLDVAGSLHNLGSMALLRGDLDQAEQLYKDAMAIRLQLIPDSLEIAKSLQNLGVVARDRGSIDEAESFSQRALKIEEKLAPDSLLVASTLQNLGSFAADKEDWNQAEQYFRDALQIKQRLAPRSLTTAISLLSLGKASCERGDLVAAVKHYKHALRIQQALAPGSTNTAEVLHEFGLLHLQESPPRLNDAGRFFQQAINAFENQLGQLGGSHDIRAGFRARYIDYYRNALDVDLRLGNLKSSFHTMERARARSFLEHLAERDTIFSADIPEDLDSRRRRLAFLFDRTQQRLVGLDPRKNSKEMDAINSELLRLRGEARNVQEEIRRISPRLASLQYPEPLDFERSRAALDPGTLMLSYAVTTDSVVIFAIARGEGLRVETLAVGLEGLREKVNRFRAQIEIGRENPQRAQLIEKTGHELYAILVAPVEDMVKASERVLIISDGPLHYMPWASLIRQTKHGSQYLVEWRPIHQVLSATVYAELKKLRDDRIVSPPLQIAAFGDPIYPRPADVSRRHFDAEFRSVAERNLFDWVRLPYSRLEVENIVAGYASESVRMFLGVEAREENVRTIGPSARIIHFATHGYVDERFPLNSFLAFTIPEVYQEGQENGLLQAWEIFERIRLDSDLVVLSACKTALGEEQGGDGLIGLTRAFQYAGARTVAASLWRVDDRATAELMTYFYHHLRDGTPKDEALRAAQLEFIRSPIRVLVEDGNYEEIDASAPYYWAAFQIYGDWK